MSVKLYMFNGSPPARTALITATAVGVSVDVKVLHKSEELHTPEFLKMNPQHTVPVLDDEGKYLSDSHAIAAYLVGKYGKDDSLYPKDLHQRAVVDQRMYYDAGVMFPVIKSCHTGFWKKEYKQLPQEKIELIKDIYKTLELFIGANKWIADDPQHTVPVLDDGGSILSDSHAIAAYLVGKYGKDDSLYPKDLHQRAVVDQRMYYDAGVMFPVIKSCLGGFLKKEYKQFPQEKIEPIKDIYKTLELFLGDNKWIAGNNVTIADISCGTSASSLDSLHSIDKKVYPKVDNWLNRVKSLPYFKVEETQLDHFKKFVQEISNWD
ncbi:hypothetical protein FQA39_LY18905 [Lamprigera yunnana]|nr:hypothetical protein FQA39_LY18905 [Lamprigera yunnana]